MKSDFQYPTNISLVICLCNSPDIVSVPLLLFLLLPLFIETHLNENALYQRWANLWASFLWPCFINEYDFQFLNGFMDRQFVHFYMGLNSAKELLPLAPVEDLNNQHRYYL